ncbi:hypothetical protein GGI25_005095 [Coemansia spiralis]|uniref:Major facilitator superfamily (MFS) profile domain-containing protein n=2 Tax=Coemansia TaxID=4863 RepID=A0A9W8G3I2_9FUNG|nr:major facilitator superfamily domain-containing protein [Coemansia spiralis]KAJ1988907.1 hypothetical protein EDC05_005002 [Coemansia umbellata]KAJ2620008.1 hypothetical protein GGI26_005357 [Coemansia sp. RSA 1358]KAJ2672492.1 hypothetical protein GGI25_005095 [Coemansia spiralis]
MQSATLNIELESQTSSEKAPTPAPVLPATDENVPPADSAYGWLVVFASFFSLMFSIGSTTTYGIYLQHYKLTEFPTASESFLSWIGTLQAAMMCFFGIGVGIISEHVDTRLLSAFGSLISGLALIIASFCSSPWKLLLTQGLMFGFGGSFLYSTGLTLAPQWFVKYRALATGIVIAGSGIGGLWLSFATTAMTNNLSRQWAQRITGLLTIGVCGAISILMKRRFKPIKRERIIDFAVVRDKRFAILFLAALFGLSGFYMPFFYMPTYSVIVLKRPENWGSNVSAILNGTSVAGRIIMGLLGDKIGALNTLSIATLVSCISILVLWLPFKSFGTFITAAVLFGFTSGAIVSMIPVVTANIFGVKRLPSIMGLVMFAYTIGALVSSPPAGAMLDKYGHGTNFTSVIVYGGVFLAVSVVADIVLRIFVSRDVWKKV